MAILPIGAQQPVVNPSYAFGCRALWQGNTGNGEINLLDRQRLTWSGTRAPLEGTPRGAGIRSTVGAGTGIHYTTTLNTSLFSVLLDVRVLALGTYKGLFQWASVTSPSSTPRVSILLDADDIRVFWDGFFRITASLPTVNTQYGYVFRWNGGTGFLYRDGVLQGSTTAAIGSDNGQYASWGMGYSDAASCVINLGAWWEVDIGAGAAIELSRNPLRIFAPRWSYLIPLGAAPSPVGPAFDSSRAFDGGLTLNAKRAFAA